MQARFAGFLIVWCVHVLRCHLAAGWDDFPSLFFSPPSTQSEECKKCGDTCLDPMLICDGIVNCEDGSDEENCDFIKCREPSFFKCREKCILGIKVCNKERDCEDGEDEENCDSKTTTEAACSSTHFRCLTNNLCIPEAWTCDGSDDCGDNSDEKLGCEQKVCKDHEFECKNKRCIPLSFRCDGSPDCADRSDEENCENRILDMTDCTIHQGKFACKDKYKCIDIHETCDSNLDCMDGSDEGGYCTSEHNKVCTNCTHLCQVTPEKAICSCPRGFIMNNNVCKDINECEEYAICDQKCLNTDGGYSCGCESPYVLQSDGRTCKMTSDDAILFYSTLNGLKGIHLQSHVNYSVNYNALSLGVTVANSFMYWTSIVQDNAGIYKASVYDNEAHEIVNSGLGVPEDIDVDWITNNIYFTDSKFKHIGVCESNGILCVVLHQKYIDKPRSLSLSPETGLLFWTDWGSKPMIGKSAMDGSRGESFVTKNIHWPNGICTDTPNDRVYWVDGKQHIIESIKFDGTDRRLISSDYVKSPFSISVFENKLYWSNWDGNEISECDKFTGKNRRSVIRDPVHPILSIHVEHPMRHAKNIENPCNNNLCSDLCLIAPGQKSHLRYSCACPEDKQLSENSKTCRLKKNAKFLIAGYKNKGYLTEPRFLGRSMFKSFSMDVESISSMAYDPAGQLIVVDSKSAFMKSYNFTTGSTTMLPEGGINFVPSMQYDYFGNNLYWCDLNTLTIEAMSLNTLAKTVIFSGTVVESPIDIALVPNEGYMFVAFLISYSNVQIDRISMDGSLMSRSRFLDEIPGSSVKLYYDVLAKRLFWANSNGFIESVNDKGKDRMFHVRASDVVSIAYVDGALFWTKRKSPYINWKESTDKTNHVNSIKFDIDDMFDDEGIIIINPNNNLTDKTSSPCSNNGGCSHLCLISNESPKKSICACPIGHALAPNGFTCKVPQPCGYKQFTCFTGECISFKKVCDKHKDCLHGEDELLENCPQTCPGDQFLCHDGTKCIDAKLYCDGNFDCNDHSDEVCHTNCTDGKFKCDDGECIESQFRCDGKVDCKNAADERNCHLTKCKGDEFRCNSGQCIHYAWYCDGQMDCTDGSDETTNCTIRGNICGSDEFHCSNDRCVNISVTCDRHDDCGDNSDEDKECIHNPYIYKQPVWYPVHHQLHVFKQCNSRTEFQCHTKAGKHCIPLAARCDGVVNCVNGEDEQNCSGKKCPHENEFFCENSGRCIPDEWVCDHHNDCGDNSDEALAACVAKNVTKKACPGFQCANGECIMMSKVCNEAPDCSDNSDEGGSCGRGCDNMQCSQKCHETPKGPYCSCEHGYTLGLDNKTCHDIDECKLDICSQNCTNTPGSFICSCFSSDYTLKSDRVTCKANGDAAHFVIASLDEMSIVTNNWMRTEHPLKLPSGSMITAMDVDNKNGIVYSVWDYSILVKINLLKMEVKKMFAPLIYGLAADWITENVYYIKDHYKIMLASFNARKSALVYAANKTVRILSMAVDPVAGYLFWYESYGGDLNGNVGMIKRADCNGENIFNMTDVIQNTVDSMTVDSYDKYLYLYEKYESVIARVNYNASSADLVLHIEPHVIGFSFFENSIYWASENSDVYPVRKCKVYGLPPRKCEVIRSKVKNVRYFGLIQESRQRIVLNPCNADVCSEICTTSPVGPKCLFFEGKNSINELQLSGKIQTASSFSTGFAYFIVICLIIALGFFGYRYYRPKSQFFHRFHFYNTPMNRSERIYSSRGSGINEMVTNKNGNAFLESVTEETIDSEFSSSRHQTSRESLIRNNL